MIYESNINFVNKKFRKFKMIHKQKKNYVKHNMTVDRTQILSKKKDNKT